MGPNSTSARPAPVITVSHPAYARAPAIHPVHLALNLAWPWPGPVENLAEIATEVITSAMK